MLQFEGLKTPRESRIILFYVGIWTDLPSCIIFQVCAWSESGLDRIPERERLCQNWTLEYKSWVCERFFFHNPPVIIVHLGEKRDVITPWRYQCQYWKANYDWCKCLLRRYCWFWSLLSISTRINTIDLVKYLNHTYWYVQQVELKAQISDVK